MAVVVAMAVVAAMVVAMAVVAAMEVPMVAATVRTREMDAAPTRTSGGPSASSLSARECIFFLRIFVFTAHSVILRLDNPENICLHFIPVISGMFFIRRATFR